MYPLVFSATSGILLSGSDSSPAVSAQTIMEVLNAITKQFSITQIVAMIAGILGVSMAFVFLWWGVRKGAKVVFRAVKSGKFSI